MARTIAQIQASIIAAKEAQPELSVFDTTSAFSLYRLWTYVVAVCTWTLEVLFDLHRDEVKAIIDTQKPHSVRWYENKAMLYQHGHALVTDQDYYDNTGLSQSAIDAARIIKYSSASEVLKGIRVKVATTSSGELSALSSPQLAGGDAYMERVKDAGVRIYFTSGPPDSLKLHLKIYYDALILDASGARLDGSSATPVADAVSSFLKNGFIFNGLFVVAKLVDALQGVDGVVIPHVVSCQSRYGLLPYADVPVQYNPDAGYLRILTPTDLVVDYEAHEPL